MIYPDLQFVSSILVIGEHSVQAAQCLRETPHPLRLSVLHRLQIENALLHLLHGKNAKQAKIARDGLRTWRHYLDEGIFVVQHFDLESAFATAAAWNAGFRSTPPKWGLVLHPAIAASQHAVFMSFDPALRKLASDNMVKLFPKRLSH